MSFGDAMQLAQTILIILGGGLALLQLRESERNRERDAALQLLRSFQTPEFASGMQLLLELPDDLDKAGLMSAVGSRIVELMAVMTTIESIGVLVYRREVSIEMVDDFFSGPINLAWRRLHGYIEDSRAESGRKTIGEFLQWLAERFAERESGTEGAVPAYIAYRDWRPRK